MLFVKYMNYLIEKKKQRLINMEKYNKTCFICKTIYETLNTWSAFKT